MVEDWFERGIKFKSISEDVIDTTTAQGRFILQIMAAIAELESSVIGDRVTAGMARAKAQGRPPNIGRKLLNVSVVSLCGALQHSSSVEQAAKKLGCSRAYIYKELASHGTTPRDVIKGCWKPCREPLDG